MTQEEFAKKFGKSRSHVTNMLGLLKLPEKTKDLIDSYADLSEEELDKVIEYVDFLKTKRNS